MKMYRQKISSQRSRQSSPRRSGRRGGSAPAWGWLGLFLGLFLGIFGAATLYQAFSKKPPHPASAKKQMVQTVHPAQNVPAQVQTPPQTAAQAQPTSRSLSKASNVEAPEKHLIAADKHLVAAKKLIAAQQEAVAKREAALKAPQAKETASHHPQNATPAKSSHGPVQASASIQQKKGTSTSSHHHRSSKGLASFFKSQKAKSHSPKHKTKVITAKPANYWVHAGIFQDKKQANSLKTRLEVLGLKPHIQSMKTSDNKALFRLALGPYTDAGLAHDIKKCLDNQKIRNNLVVQGPKT